MTIGQFSSKNLKFNRHGAKHRLMEKDIKFNLREYRQKIKILGVLGRCSAASLPEEADGHSRLGWGDQKIANMCFNV